ncbi:MAG: dockerin type I repeat-containing protein [Oscillospiraceae bacterium]
MATGYNVVFDTEPSTKYTAIVSADINCDGFVNILDLVRFKKHLAGAATLSQIQRKAADLNFNSQLTR